MHTMSSTTNARTTPYAEQRYPTENGNNGHRAPSAQQAGDKPERSDSKRQRSPGPSHRRVASGLQRTSRGVEERRTENVKVTTRETLTSRTRSPERRPGTSRQASERSKPPEASRQAAKDAQPRSSKAEPPQGMDGTRIVRLI